MSPERGWASGRSSKQPRLPTSESYAPQAVPGGAGGRANNFGLGGAALTFATAAHKNFCLLPDVNISMLLSLVLCLFALALPLWSQINPGAPVTPPTPEPQVNPATPNPQVNLPPAAPQQNAPTIARIQFQGTRRIRNETLTARIL